MGLILYEGPFILMRFFHGYLAQIREQMCLETHFQYEFSILGRFGQSGLQRKYATFEASFLCFHGQKMILKKF